MIQTNNEYDNEFKIIQRELQTTLTPQNFLMIYDFAKRYINQFGLNACSIEKIYLLGYINGKKT